MSLVYEPNPKHKEPWQRGRKGTLCPHWAGLDPSAMLKNSIQHGDKRFATHNGMAFVAQCHQVNNDIEYWHGYPEGWEHIPTSISRAWIKNGSVTRKEISKLWKRSSLGDEE